MVRYYVPPAPRFWVSVLAMLALITLSLLAGSVSSAPPTQTLQPVSYLPLVVGRSRYEIAYVSRQNGNLEIFKMNMDGSNQTNLTNNPARDGGWTSGGLEWSPDGSQIAFVSYRDSSDEIYVMDADGSHQTDLSNSPAEDTKPIWSPDGRQIAFSSNRDETSDLYVLNADGSNLHRLITNLKDARAPVLSPDWRRVAFEVTDTCDMEFCYSDIYTMNIDGSGRINLTPGPGDDYHPIWSPDGQRIAFASSYIFYVMNADGSNKTKIGPDRGLVEQYVWSPSGRQIAFSIYSGNMDLWFYVVNNDGTGLTELPECRDPAWSPDGLQIACSGISVMNADGTHHTQLTNNSDSDRGPVWSPPIR